MLNPMELGTQLHQQIEAVASGKFTMTDQDVRQYADMLSLIDDSGTIAMATTGGWLAFYLGRGHKWRVARDARGQPIVCETYELAHSVAGYRRRRLKPWS